jgi:predicted nucleic acid-binding protein
LKILVDSSVWIDYLNQAVTVSTQSLDELLADEPLLIGDLILCEVLQGFRIETAAALAQRFLSRFEIVTLCSPNLAITAATNYRFLRSRGITIRKTIDIIIGTFCIEHGHALLHSDRDFEPMERLLGLQAI